MQPPSIRRPPAAILSRRFVIPRAPLIPVLLAVVIAIAGGLVAVVLLPLFGAFGVGVNAISERIDAEGVGIRIRVPHFPERSTIYASDGSTLATLYLDENRDLVHLDRVADVAQQAVLAIEDDRFYQHGAVSISSIIRAFLANAAAGDIQQGGSTITQQVVKNAIIENSQQTLARKFQEAAVAIRVERRYTKDEILELYLNDVYFGHDVYGIGTAARYYFNEPASGLTLGQAALLAGLIRSPGDYDPVVHPNAARARRDEVLDRMQALGWITSDQADAARAKPVHLSHQASEPTQKVQPFFVYYLRNLIIHDAHHEFDAFGRTREQRIHTLYQGGLKVYTTLDPAWQRYAQEAVDASPYIRRTGGPDVSLVSVDPGTGAIRAMLSGKDYKRDQLDLVWHGTRQVGSAFKPFTLTAAFEQKVPRGKVYSSRSPFCSSAWTSEDHCVSNAEPGDRGYIDLATATAESVNVVFAQLALDIGPDSIVRAAHAMGITAPLQPIPSITLGTEEVSTLDMASAYSTLANDGARCRPFAIARVLEPGGKPLYRHKPQCEQAIDRAIAHEVTFLLQGVVRSGTGVAAALPRPVAGKTGTTQDYTNVYFAGYTPQVATAVWVGFPEGQISLESYYHRPVFGGTIAAPIWHTFMLKATAGMPVASFPAPPPEKHGTVPHVVGMTSAAAQAAIAKARFTTIVHKVDSSQPVNTVIEQSPRGGTRAPLGGAVHVTVSNGQGKPVKVPRVIGLGKVRAVAAIEAAGLVAKLSFVTVSDKAKVGVVVTQSPSPDAMVDAGSTVALEIGRPQAARPLPRAPTGR